MRSLNPGATTISLLGCLLLVQGAGCTGDSGEPDDSGGGDDAAVDDGAPDEAPADDAVSDDAAPEVPRCGDGDCNGAETCTTCPGDCGTCTGDIVVGLVPSRTGGIAPLAVFFDASSTTASGIARPFHELGYEWNFGDPSSGSWAVSGNSRDADRGPLAAHVYERPGSYTVTLNVRDAAGRSNSAETVITVDDPDAAFAGERTVCVSTGGDFGGCPGGARQVTSAGFGTLQGLVETNTRILFRRGDHWVVDGGIAVTVPGPGHIGAFGPCDAPDGRGLCSNAPWLESQTDELVILDIPTRTSERNDWRVVDLRLSGPSCDASAAGESCGSAMGWLTNVRQLLLLRLEVEGFRVGLGNSSWEILDDEIAIVSSEVSRGWINQVYIGASRLMLLGNHFHDSPQSHVLRVWQASPGVIAHNEIAGASTESDSGRHALKLHGFDPGAGWPLTDRVLVADNRFGASGPWPVGVGPQDGGSNEPVTNVILEKNLFRSATTSTPVQVSLEIWARDVTVRNNVFVGTGAAAEYTAVAVSRRGVEPVPERVQLLNNTVFRSDTATSLLLVDAASADATLVQNNLAWATATGTIGIGGGTITGDDNLAGVDPLFTAPLDDQFSLGAGSPAVDVGVPVPVFDDFAGINRPVGAGWDMGAFERP
jgi:PKD repeat protein